MDAKKVNGSGNGTKGSNEWRVKVGLAEMLKGGVIMDVTNAEQAKIAEKAGACAVMALERVPSDIRKEGGVARMASTKVIREIMAKVTIPVMAKVRIGHFAEAEVLQALEVDFIDESEVLTPADEENHIWKHDYRVPFVCGARNLGEALRRIGEGAAMIRTKGEAGSGNVVEAVLHMRAIVSQMKKRTTMRGKWKRKTCCQRADGKKIRSRELKIGILAVEGDFEAHAAMLARLGVQTVEVRPPGDLEGCDGLILPGGESTTQLQFLQEEGLAEAIEKFAKQGGAIFGTCAGAILLATEVQNPRQDSLKLLDMTVLRNGYGRQIASDVVSGPTKLKNEPLEMVFIPGPILQRARPVPQGLS